MQIFHYKAVDANGRRWKGRLAAPGEEALETRLARMDLDLITCRPASPRRPLRRAIGRRDLIQFCFQLEHLIGAGVPLLQALAELHESLENPAFRGIVSSVAERIGEGSRFSGALAEFPRVFDPLFVNLVRAGEESGQLPEVLHDLTESLKWHDELSARTRQVLAYPAFVAVVVTGVIFFLMLYLVPQLARFIAGMQGALPIHTRALLATSEFLLRYWALLLALPAALAAAVTLAVRHHPGLALRLDEYKLRTWLLGEILRKLALARFARLFGLMYRAGIPVLEILQFAAEAADNRAIRRAIAQARERIGNGQGIAGAFEGAALFPPLVLRMIGTGETTGALDTALSGVSYFYDRDVRERVDRLESMIGPALTIVLGALLGWMMLAVLGPVYDLLVTLRV